MNLFKALQRSLQNFYAKDLALLLLSLTLIGCDSKPDISLPGQDHLSQIYPIGFHRSNIDGVSHFIISRYSGRPVLLYLPKYAGPYPIVLFQHGRPFKMPSQKAYYPNDEFVSKTLNSGYALAVAIRSGYFGDTHPDYEKIPCNNPEYDDFEFAADSARNDVGTALRYIRGLNFIDTKNIVLAGTSAGGFTSIASLSSFDDQVSSVISINGGRCGKRGRAIGGLKNIRKLYKEIANDTKSPVYFLAGSMDDVIPEYSTKKLYESFCKIRNDCSAEKSVHLIQAYAGNHHIDSMLDAYAQALLNEKNK